MEISNNNVSIYLWVQINSIMSVCVYVYVEQLPKTTNHCLYHGLSEFDEVALFECPANFIKVT